MEAATAKQLGNQRGDRMVQFRNSVTCTMSLSLDIDTKDNKKKEKEHLCLFQEIRQIL